jgi:hypothetical protein
MRRDQLEHAIRTACQIAGLTEVIVVGSQAILGIHRRRAAARCHQIVGNRHPAHRGRQRRNHPSRRRYRRGRRRILTLCPTPWLSIDGVDLQTSALPDGWRERLVKVQNQNTPGPSGEPQFIGLCLDKEDLCVAKLCAFREKDPPSRALITAELVDPAVIAARLTAVPQRYRTAAQRAANWLAHQAKRDG